MLHADEDWLIEMLDGDERLRDPLDDCGNLEREDVQGIIHDEGDVIYRLSSPE